MAQDVRFAVWVRSSPGGVVAPLRGIFLACQPGLIQLSLMLIVQSIVSLVVAVGVYALVGFDIYFSLALLAAIAVLTLVVVVDWQVGQSLRKSRSEHGKSCSEPETTMEFLLWYPAMVIVSAILGLVWPAIPISFGLSALRERACIDAPPLAPPTR